MGSDRPADWPDLAGRLTAEGHVLPVRIYFEDTDFTGVVYHAAYLRFMERGRSDFVRLLGIGHTDLGAGVHGEQLAFAVRRIAIDYFKPARIDDLLEVRTAVEKMAGARIVLHQTISRDGEKLTEAEVTVVLVNHDGKARRLPDSFIERITGKAAD